MHARSGALHLLALPGQIGPQSGPTGAGQPPDNAPNFDRASGERPPKNGPPFHEG